MPVWSRRHCLTPLVFAVSLLFVGCGGGTTTVDSSLLASPQIAQLRSAPEQVTLSSGTSLHLTPYLWRDFQPVSPPDGKPMIAVFTVETTDQAPIPDTVHVTNAWVINRNETWQVKPAEEQPRTSGSSQFEVVGRNGPKWGPDISVDVIVEVRDNHNTAYLLQSRQQLIHRTD